MKLDFKNLRAIRSNKLTELLLSNEGVSNTSMRLIVGNLPTRSNIEKIDFSNNHISGEILALLMAVIEKLPQLQEIDLTNNYLLDTGAEIAILLTANSLRTVTISSNRFEAAEFSKIAQGVEQATSLKSFAAQHCTIDDEGFAPVCRAFVKQASLEELNLASNELHLKALLPLLKIPSLRVLNVGNNYLYDSDMPELLNHVSKNFTLTDFAYSHKDLTDRSKRTRKAINRIAARNTLFAKVSSDPAALNSAEFKDFKFTSKDRPAIVFILKSLTPAQIAQYNTPLQLCCKKMGKKKVMSTSKSKRSVSYLSQLLDKSDLSNEVLHLIFSKGLLGTKANSTLAEKYSPKSTAGSSSSQLDVSGD